MSRPPKRFVDDFPVIDAANVVNVERRPKVDKNLYEVEIVDVTKTNKNTLRGFQ